MRAMVTGAAGFIGVHLVARLLSEGHEVIAFDNLSSSRINNLNLIVDGDQSRFSLILGDIRDADVILKAMAGCDVVFHLAAAGSVPESIEKPLFYHENNVTGTFNVLLAARQSGVRTVVFSSSAAVYGDKASVPNMEGMAPFPISPYAANKLAGEAYCAAFYRSYGLQTRVFRFFNVFGPVQNPNSQYAAAIPKFISACTSGEAITIFGDGLQTRDFVYVDDVVHAMVLSCDSDESLCGQPINVATGVPISVNKLALTIRSLMNSESEIQYLPPRPGDIRDSYASIESLKAVSFRLPISLEEGLARMVRPR